MSSSIAIALLFASFSNPQAATVHYVEIVNTAPSDLVALAVARPATHGESQDFHAIDFGNGPLHGGGGSATVAIRADRGDCLRDLRTTFADGRTLLQRSFDVCRYRSDHLGRYLHRTTPEAMLAQP